MIICTANDCFKMLLYSHHIACTCKSLYWLSLRHLIDFKTVYAFAYSYKRVMCQSWGRPKFGLFSFSKIMLLFRHILFEMRFHKIKLPILNLSEIWLLPHLKKYNTWRKTGQGIVSNFHTSKNYFNFNSKFKNTEKDGCNPDSLVINDKTPIDFNRIQDSIHYLYCL